MRRTRHSALAGNILVGLVTLLAASPGLAQQEADRKSDPSAVKPEELVRGVADFLGAQAKYECKITAVMEIAASGLQNRMESVTALRVDRPSRFALVLESGFTGATMICDGETLVLHLPMLQRYSREEAPEDITTALTDPTAQALSMAGPVAGVVPIGGDAYYTTMMADVTDSTYIGEEVVDGVRCDHCRFQQSELSWDLWVQKGDRPVPRKITFDLAKQLAAEMNPMLKGAQVDFHTLFSDWNFNPRFTDEDFQFDPPEGATEVEDLIGDMLRGADFDDQPHPLLSKPAPVFEADDLNQNSIDLADHFGKQIVILDFWATWCGPCVDALPQIVEVAKEYQNRRVKFFAVNVGEDAETVGEFLNTSEIDVNVLLDPEGAVSDLFQAEAIPQTVIVGLGGKVQVVHVGLGQGLKEQLSKELDRLLAGEDLAKETLERAEKTMREASADDFGASLVWSCPSRAIGLVSDDAAARIFAVTPTGAVDILDAAGSKIGSTKMGSGGKIRRATLVAGADPEFLTYGNWGHAVSAFTADGKELWDYALGEGIDDVWAADLDGDGADEVIIGYNGSTGLHVLDQRGTLVWKYTDIGNVWHVAAGDVDNDGQPEVVTTSAAGQIHIFSADGTKEKDIDIAVYANMIRTAVGVSAGPAQILVAGSDDAGEALVSVSSSAEQNFQLSLPAGATDHVDEMIVAGDRPWAAVAMRGGLLHVVDLSAGKIVASVTVPGPRLDVGWLHRPDRPPLLLTASGRAVAAYQVDE